MAHTPGPWTAEERVGEDLHLGPTRAWYVDGADGSSILAVSGMREADARLIAVAPELLEALRELARTTTVDRDGNYHCEGWAWRMAHDAITKATGESPPSQPTDDGGTLEDGGG